jgi:hypothetical protein
MPADQEAEARRIQRGSGTDDTRPREPGEAQGSVRGFVETRMMPSGFAAATLGIMTSNMRAFRATSCRHVSPGRRRQPPLGLGARAPKNYLPAVTPTDEGAEGSG